MEKLGRNVKRTASICIAWSLSYSPLSLTFKVGSNSLSFSLVVPDPYTLTATVVKLAIKELLFFDRNCLEFVQM